MNPEDEPEVPITEEVEVFEPAFEPTEKLDAVEPTLAEAVEVLKDGSELAGDRLDTMVLSTHGFGELANYFIADRGAQNPVESEYNTTGIGTSLSEVGDHLGEYTAMNGFLAYVPNTGLEYCLMADTIENRAAVESKGYKSTINLGVYSFKGEEQLETRLGTGGDPTLLNAQIELLKLQSEHDGTRHFIEAAASSADQVEIDRLQGQFETEEMAIKDTREHVASVASEKPYLVTRFA